MNAERHTMSRFRSGRSLGLAMVGLTMLTTVAALAPAQAGNEHYKAVEQLTAKVQVAMITGGVDHLDKWFESYRSSRARFPDGSSALHRLYDAVIDSEHFPHGKQGLQLWEEFTAGWSKAHPRSPAPHILMAKQHVEEAWRIRGTNTADGVWDDAWKPYREHLQRARSILLDSKEVSARDPEWYALMISVCMELGQPFGPLERLFEEGVRSEPLYEPTLDAIMRAHSTKWGGDPRRAARLARRHADRVGGDQGDILYFYMFQQSFNHAREIGSIVAAGFNTTRAAAGLKQIVKTFPTRTVEDYQLLEWLTCQVGTPELLQIVRDGFNTTFQQPREILEFDYYCRKGKYAEPKPIIAPAPLLQDATAGKSERALRQ